jgi:hypothetical protein
MFLNSSIFVFWELKLKEKVIKIRIDNTLIEFAFFSIFYNLNYQENTIGVIPYTVNSVTSYEYVIDIFVNG